MKADIHPEYRFVVFRDVNNGHEFLTRSTLSARDTTTFEGQEYPLVVAEVTSESHPFYTGTQRIMDTEGRVERFMRKYGFAGDANAEAAEESAEAPAAAEEAPADEAPAAAAEAPPAEG